MTGPAPYFARETGSGGEILVPEEATASGWNREHMRGPAVTAVLARAAERSAGERPDLRPARATFELFRPAFRVPSRTTSRVVRQGRRLLLVDTELVQDDEVVARASTLFLAATGEAVGALWSPDLRPCPPPVGTPTDAFGRAYRSGGGWTSMAEDHLNAERKHVWQAPITVVRDEIATPFQLAAVAADMTNLTVHWGDVGVEYINADVTLAMARLPHTDGVGLVALDRSADSGVAFGTTVLHDRAGIFGTALVTAVANSHRTVQPGGSVG